jgi:hypothetical protein
MLTYSWEHFRDSRVAIRHFENNFQRKICRDKLHQVNQNNKFGGKYEMVVNDSFCSAECFTMTKENYIQYNAM